MSIRTRSAHIPRSFWDAPGHTGVQGDAPDVALQDDGKIVVVSGRTLARYNANGSLDGGFATGGVVTVDFYGSRDRLNAVGIQPDGRIVVAGYSQDAANSPVQEDYIVARYDADGTLDTASAPAARWLPISRVTRTSPTTC